jgi:hypothetical protein
MLIHENTDIIPDLTLLLLEVCTTSVMFPMASIVPDPATRVESSVEAATASIHYL